MCVCVFVCVCAPQCVSCNCRPGVNELLTISTVVLAIM